MKEVIAHVTLIVTIVPFLFVAVLLAFVGLSGWAADGYTDWINGICECKVIEDEL